MQICTVTYLGESWRMRLAERIARFADRVRLPVDIELPYPELESLTQEELESLEGWQGPVGITSSSSAIPENPNLNCCPGGSLPKWKQSTTSRDVPVPRRLRTR